MSKNLQSKIALATMSAVVATTAITPVQASQTTVSNTQATNVSTWAEAEVKDFLGNSFNPNYNYKFKVTRAEFAELLEKALVDIGYAFNEPSGNPFKDTKNKSVIKMYQAGLLAGTGDTTFSPNDSLTREQLAVIICRIYEELKVPMPKKVVYSVTDHNKISTWARSSVKMAYEANIILGDATGYNPKAIVPREQAIVILSRTQDTIQEYKKAQENGNKPDNNGGNNNGNTQNKDEVVNNNLYTYNKQTKEIVIKKDCILDVNQSGTPKEFTKVTVNKGVETEFKGIKITNLILEEESQFKGTSCDIGNVTMKDDSEFITDKASTVKEIKTYNTSSIDTDGAKVDKVIVYESDTKSKISIEGDQIKDVIIEAPAIINIDGEVSKISIDGEDAVVTVTAKVDDIEVNEDDVELILKSGAKVDSLKLEGETELSVAKDVRVKKLSVEDDAIDSVIELKSKYDIDLSIKAKCKINGYRVDEDDDVEYKDGKLYINDSDKGSATEDDEDLEDVEAVLEKLTYDKLLGKNQDKDNIIYDLELPTEMNGCSISWMSDNEAVITNSGKVTRIDKGSEVELRAKVKKGNASENKSFEFYVLPAEQKLEDKLKADLDKIQIPSTISENYTLPTQTENKYALSYATNHSNARVNGNTLEVTRSDKDVEVTLTITATSGSTFQKVTRTFVIPKKDTVTPPAEDKDKVVTDAFAKVSIPETLEIPTNVPKVIDGVTFTITSSGNAVTVSESGSDFVLTPNKSAQDQTVTLTITGTYKEHTKQFTKSVTVKAEAITEDKDAIVNSAWEKFSKAIPDTLTSETTISANVDGVTFAVSSEQPGITTTNGENVVLTPHPTTEEQQVNLSITGTYKDVTKSYTKYVTVPKKDEVPETGKTEEDIRQDMQNVLGAFTVEDKVPFTVSSGIEGVGEYSVTLNPVNKYISVESDGQQFVVTHDGTLLSEPQESGVVVKLTYFMDGKPVEEDRTITIQVLPKYTEEEWISKLDTALANILNDLVAKIPTKLNGTSAPIPMYHTMDVDGVDFLATIVPQLGPNVKEPTPADDKLEITYDATNHFTLNPKVLDGSTVTLKVKFAYQLGNSIKSMPREVNILLEKDETPNEEAFKTLKVSAEIFEIINTIDVTFQNTVSTPEFKLVIKDKHLDTVLGEIESITLPNKGENNFGGTAEVTLSKNAILGEYIYELHSGDKVVKTGDLVNNGSTLSFTKEK